MKELQGKFGTAKIFTDLIEQKAEDQIETISFEEIGEVTMSTVVNDIMLDIEAELESSNKYIREYEDTEVQRAYNKGLSVAYDIIKKYENSEATTEFSVDDLTEDEIMLIKMAFKSVEESLELLRYNHYCSLDLCNALFNLKEKMGISCLFY